MVVVCGLVEPIATAGLATDARMREAGRPTEVGPGCSTCRGDRCAHRTGRRRGDHSRAAAAAADRPMGIRTVPAAVADPASLSRVRTTFSACSTAARRKERCWWPCSKKSAAAGP